MTTLKCQLLQQLFEGCMILSITLSFSLSLSLFFFSYPSNPEREDSKDINEYWPRPASNLKHESFHLYCPPHIYKQTYTHTNTHSHTHSGMHSCSTGMYSYS